MDYECALFFDYKTGKILNYGVGVNDNVKLEYDVDEFKGRTIASIHNHPFNAFSPPSGKNFNIFLRNFEDYELVVGREDIWILKAKGVHENLIKEVRDASLTYYILTLAKCGDPNKSLDEMMECEDHLYGRMLSKYINDKNITDIQLIKKEYKK